tara:strand:+ start:3258 stop:4544 length:1287 start_codon:yes stop_codon:yes gene_type:complete
MSQIINIHSRQILDSRGNPTLEVEVELDSGATGWGAVPSGASTGSFEAFELRDGDKKSFHGKSVKKAVDHINGEIFETLKGFDALDQVHIDQTLCELDGTDNKSRLGANALLGTSIAVARAAADEMGLPLYRYLAGPFSHIMPVPMINILNGGAHADNKLDIQEFMIVPVGAESFSEAIQYGYNVIQQLKLSLKAKGLQTNVGDEGGFAPAINSTREALDHIMKAIEMAGLRPGKDVALALDVAATEFYTNNLYIMDGEKQKFTAEKLVDFYKDLTDAYPIISIEDGMAEEDWDGWQHLTGALGHEIQLVGDDLFVTNPERLERGVASGVANAILIKPNQIGTITETVYTVQTAQRYGYSCVMSHRSGETEDTTIADMAVALGTGQIKTGSLARTDRVAKYNQLLRIEEELKHVAYYPGGDIFLKTFD